MENKPLPNQGAKPSNETTQGLSQESEWKVVLNKIQAWLGATRKISDQLDEFFNPSILILVLGVIAICLKAYSTILNAIDDIPLAASIFEVIGTLWLTRFSITRLLRKQDRQEFFSEANRRWRNFVDP